MSKKRKYYKKASPNGVYIFAPTGAVYVPPHIRAQGVPIVMFQGAPISLDGGMLREGQYYSYKLNGDRCVRKLYK